MRSLLWVALAAVLISLSRLPLHMGWLVFIAWIPLYHYLQLHKVKLWAAAGVFALIYIGVIFYWIAEVTPGGLVGIAIIFFLYYWLSFYAIRRIGHVFPRLKYCGFIAVMLSFEYLQNFSEMRFPWFHNAYSLADYTVLIQAADLGGVILLSGLILAVNVLIYQVLSGYVNRAMIAKTANNIIEGARHEPLHSNTSALQHPSTKTPALIAIIAIFVVWFSYGIISLKALPYKAVDAKIAVMQPSIPQDEKWDQAVYNRILERYDQLCAQAAADSTKLLIFPEAAMPVYLMMDYLSLDRLKGFCRTYNLDIFTGFPHYTPAPPEHVNEVFFYNAAALFKPDGYISKLYYKNILVPVGERMLWLKTFPFLWKLQFGQANWEFGTKLEWMRSGDYEFSPSICYEIAFANLYLRSAIPKDAKTGKLRKTDYLVNITNDAWFGTSYGPWLHAIMTKFRAVENRIQIYRSANTGISMIVDPWGRVISKAGLFETTNLTAPLNICKRIPLYRHIAWYPWLIVGFAVLVFIISLFHRRGQA